MQSPSTQLSVPAVIPVVPRLGSIDAYRGLVMFLMLAEVWHLNKVAQALPASGFWAFLALQQSHSLWVGCTLHDLIQPSFSFLVGVALPFSLASRASRGQAQWKMTLHACWRGLLLVLLGVFLRSLRATETNWTFIDTLSQIGLGYPILYWLGRKSVRTQAIALAVIFIGYWALWAGYPIAPGTGWEHDLSGFAAHWNKGGNVGDAFDLWFLNLFPRERPFTGQGGGYGTLSFIPTLGTMLLGVIAGRWLRADLTPGVRLKKMLLAAGTCLAASLILHGLGICPIVKPVWTPAWALFSGGLCFLFMAGFYAIIDLAEWRAWSLPLRVIGMNSIAAYLMSYLMAEFVTKNLVTHLGPTFFSMFGEAYVSLVRGSCVLGVFWLILYWMFRRKIFLKI